MKKLVILLIVIIISNMGLVLVEGREENIDFTYPSNVKVGEEFEVNVRLLDFTEDVYDVKIDIVNKSVDGTKHISEIFWDKENKWKSTNYYVTSIMNVSEKNNETFKLKIVDDYEGKNNITVKIRSSSKKVMEFKGYEIIINYETSELDDNKSISSTKQDNESEDNESEDNESKNSDSKVLDNDNKPKNIITGNVIRLGEKIDIKEAEDIKTKGYKVYESKATKIKEYSVYAFALLCVILCILIVWGKL